jgi:sortase A
MLTVRNISVRRVLSAGLLVVGAVFLLRAAYIPAKAALAQVLLEQAWAKARADGVAVKPWPWADIATVAEIAVPRLGRHDIVLEGVSGQAMAFGPGHMPNTPAIGAPGTAVVAAHRDTQFAYLKDVVPGDRIEARGADGRTHVFRVASTRIVRADASGLDPGDGGPNGARLALVTCYPFNGVFHSPWRYVVLADAIEGGHEIARVAEKD